MLGENVSPKTNGLISILGKSAPRPCAEPQTLVQKAICLVGGAGRGVLVGQ